MSLLSLVGLLLLRVFSREGVLLVFGAGTCKSSVFVWVGLTGGLGVSWVLFEVPAVLVGFGWSIMVFFYNVHPTLISNYLNRYVHRYGLISRPPLTRSLLCG